MSERQPQPDRSKQPDALEGAGAPEETIGLSKTDSGVPPAHPDVESPAPRPASSGGGDSASGSMEGHEG